MVILRVIIQDNGYVKSLKIGSGVLPLTYSGVVKDNGKTYGDFSAQAEQKSIRIVRGDKHQESHDRFWGWKTTWESALPASYRN